MRFHKSDFLQRLYFVLLPLFFASQSFGVSKTAQIVVGIYDFAPHVIVSADALNSPNGDIEASSLKGAMITFLKNDISKKANINIQFKIFPFARILNELEREKIDLAVCIAKNPERLKLFQFPQEPFIHTKSAVIVRKDGPSEIKTTQELRGKKIGHVLGSIIPPYLNDLDIKFELLSGTDYLNRNLQKLGENKIDAVFIPTLSNGAYVLANSGNKKEFKILPLPIESLGLYVVARKGLESKLFSRIDQAFKGSEKRYEKYLNPYLN